MKFFTLLLLSIALVAFGFQVGIKTPSNRLQPPRNHHNQPTRWNNKHYSLPTKTTTDLIQQIASVTKSTTKKVSGKTAASAAAAAAGASSIFVETPKYLKLFKTIKNFLLRQFLINPLYTFLYLYGFVYLLSVIGNIFKPVVRSVDKLRNKNGKIDLKQIEELKNKSEFDIYECEVCQMELRPAKGRAKIVLAKPAFRCPKCGAKSVKFFNIYDMKDSRAKARWERLQREREEEERELFGDDDENESS
eukprot:gene7982-8627_t